MVDLLAHISGVIERKLKRYEPLVAASNGMGHEILLKPARLDSFTVVAKRERCR